MITDFPSSAMARGTLGTMLEHVLTQESRLAAATHDYAWRVRGSPLQSLRRLVAEQARQIDRWFSDLVQCARALGVAAAVLQPADVESTAREGIAEMLSRHEAVLAELREVRDVVYERDPDGDAALLLGGLIEFHESSAWMLRLVLNERGTVV